MQYPRRNLGSLDRSGTNCHYDDWMNFSAPGVSIHSPPGFFGFLTPLIIGGSSAW